MKRAILFGVCLLLGGVQPAYSISRGAPADRNGLNGQYCTACHRTNPLNMPGGSVSVGGLPSAWIPGNVYTLRVMIVRPESTRWGFQMSAVDGGGEQAGEFIAGSDGRSQIVTAADANGRQIQFITHTSIGTGPGGTNVYEFSYRAPSNAALGDIRFHIAGNAANGNQANTGDFIYAIQTTVSSAVTSSRSFNLAARGAASTTTDGRGAALATGYARVDGGGGNGPSAAHGMVAFRPGGILVGETVVSSALPILSGRIPLETGGGINTGIALTNSSSQTAAVNYFLTNSSGAQIYSGSIAVAPNSQIAAFIDQPAFFTSNPFRTSLTDPRTMTFTSSVPVAVVAIRGRTNERSEFLMSTVPVADLSVSTTDTAYVPHFADGGGWSTGLVLTNTSDEVMTGSVQFSGQSGQTLTLAIDGQSGARFDYSIPARASKTLRTSGSATSTTLGSIRISPASTSKTPAALAILSSRRNNVVVSEVAIPAVKPLSGYRVYVENSGNFAGPEAGSLQTAFAAANPSSSPITLNLELTSMDGTASGFTGSLSVPAQGQAMLFLNQVEGFSAVPNSFQGVLRLSTASSSGVSVAGVRARYNERTPAPDLILSGLAATDDAASAPSDLLIPYLADSGGYTTQFVLVGGSTATSTGTLRLFDQSGRSLTLTLR